MKSSFLLILFGLLSFAFVAEAQGNRKPQIVGQDPLRMNEDESLTILMTYLDVQDRDNWFYPWGFTMTVHPGANYVVEGAVVTPTPDFNGKLVVQVSVNDGENDSNKFGLEITVDPVNDRPLITGHSTLTTNENQPITVETSHLKVSDPDNKYPGDFTMTIGAGNNYSISGHTVTPQSGFSGRLTVTVTVNDGQVTSDPYTLPIDVKAINRVPEITGQAALQVNEDASITIALSHLTVRDEDNNYPQGFNLSLSAVDNYTVSNTTITPASDFYGKITVPVTVNDGKNTSKPFNLAIAVTPINDMPEITDLEAEPVFYGTGDPSVLISEAVSVSEVDGDSIMFAEIGIRPDRYQMAVDKLVYVATTNSNIRGVFDPNTGVLTLLGQASPASYTSALRSVHYQAIAPAGEDKVLYMSVNDGKSDSEEVERLLSFGEPAVSLDIPSGFTPNGDSANDTWKIIPLKEEEHYASARIKVYNKAGVLVYESVGLDAEWDGRLNGELLPADTYFYTIDLNLNSPKGYLKGLVTILR